MAVSRGLIRRKRTLSAATESTTGTAVTTSALGLVVYDAEVSFEIPEFDRPDVSGYGNLYSESGAQQGKVTATVECQDGGAVWSTTLLTACGVDGGNEVTNDAKTTITIGLLEDGRLWRIAGAMGTCVFNFRVGEPVTADFEFSGKYVAPSDASFTGPTSPTEVVPVYKGATVAIPGKGAYPVGDRTIDLGNEVVMREDATDATGFKSAQIVTRNVRATASIESHLVANQDFVGGMAANSLAACTVTVGGVTWTMPKAQIVSVASADKNGIMVEELEMRASRDSSNTDEFSITV